MKHDEYHRQFAEGIIEQIRQGTAPWQKPWGPGERVLPLQRRYGPLLQRAGTACISPPWQQERGYGDVRWGTYRQTPGPGTDRCARASRALASSRSRTTGRSPSTTSAAGPRGTTKASAFTATSASRRPSSANTPCSTPSRPTGCPTRAHTHGRAALEGASAGRAGPRGRRGARPSRGGRPGVLQR